MMPIMAGWTNGNFKLGGMFNVWTPSGEYTSGAPANQGLGYWTFEPMLAFSWLSSKIGTEFSVFTAVDFNTVNTTWIINPTTSSMWTPPWRSICLCSAASRALGR